MMVPTPNKVAEFLFDQRPMSHRFRVLIDDLTYDLGTWSRVAGLTVRWNKLTYRTGEDSREEVFPGTVANETLKLSRAACSDSSVVQAWLASTTKHRRAVSGVVQLVDFVFLPVVTWTFGEMFPIAWSIGEFDSTAGKPVIETLELAHTGFLDDAARVTG